MAPCRGRPVPTPRTPPTSLWRSSTPVGLSSTPPTSTATVRSNDCSGPCWATWCHERVWYSPPSPSLAGAMARSTVVPLGEPYCPRWTAHYAGWGSTTSTCGSCTPGTTRCPSRRRCPLSTTRCAAARSATSACATTRAGSWRRPPRACVITGSCRSSRSIHCWNGASNARSCPRRRITASGCCRGLRWAGVC